MQSCGRCGGGLEATFRYCPWCAEPQRRKIVEFFAPHPSIEHPGRALRVSRYLGSLEDERHVRVSIWNESGTAEAALSLGDGEAERLGGFLVGVTTATRRAPASLFGRLRSAVRV